MRSICPLYPQPARVCRANSQLTYGFDQVLTVDARLSLNTSVTIHKKLSPSPCYFCGLPKSVPLSEQFFRSSFNSANPRSFESLIHRRRRRHVHCSPSARLARTISALPASEVNVHDAALPAKAIHSCSALYICSQAGFVALFFAFTLILTGLSPSKGG